MASYMQTMQDVPGHPIIGDRYRLLKKIGEGGMGEVYLAEHVYIEKRVAIKLLRPEILSNAEAVIRFRQEARSASSIGHKNIIEIDDFGTLPDGRIYMAMEYLQGEALNDILARGPLPLPRALDILIQVTQALAAAHAKGITHRDMKPENIFITTKDGRDVPKILDFGIAKVSGADSGKNLTVAGAIFGTPFYMAPEQAMGAKMDHRVDIYAMGVILYEIFCGTVPFKAESFMGILMQHISAEPVPPSQMAAANGRIVEPQLEAIILKAMRKNPADRYQTMNELGAALIDYYRVAVGTPLSGHEVIVPVVRVPPPRRLWPIVLGAVGAGALAGVVMWRVLASSTPVGPTAPDAAPIRVATPDAAVGVGPGPGPSPGPGPGPDAAVAPQVVKVWIRSDPEGATVVRGDEEIGLTPLQVEVIPGMPQRFTLKLRGYFNAEVLVTGATAEVSQEMEASGLHPLP